MTAQPLYSLTTKAGRAKIADAIQKALSEVSGAVVTRTDEGGPYRARRVSIGATVGQFQVGVCVDGGSTWGIIGHWSPSRDWDRVTLLPSSFQRAIGSGWRAQAHHKATGPFMGNTGKPLPITQHHLDAFCTCLWMAAQDIADGGAFERQAVAA